MMTVICILDFGRYLGGFGIRRDEPGNAPLEDAQVEVRAIRASMVDYWGIDPRIQWALVVGWIGAVCANAERLQRAGLKKEAPKFRQVEAANAYLHAGVLPYPDEWAKRMREVFNKEIQGLVAIQMAKALEEI